MMFGEIIVTLQVGRDRIELSEEGHILVYVRDAQASSFADQSVEVMNGERMLIVGAYVKRQDFLGKIVVRLSSVGVLGVRFPSPRN